MRIDHQRLKYKKQPIPRKDSNENSTNQRLEDLDAFGSNGLAGSRARFSRALNAPMWGRLMRYCRSETLAGFAEFVDIELVCWNKFLSNQVSSNRPAGPT